MPGDSKTLIETLDELRPLFEGVFNKIEEESEDFWNSLSHDDQLKVFCAVVRRIHKGEIQDGGSYRYVLYDVFNFGPEAYMQAQMSGYLDIHNSIYQKETQDEG